MTRLFTAVFAVFALALGACERHPIQGQTEVTHTHGSNGAPGEHHDSHAAAPVKHEEKKADAAHAPAGAGHEEKPAFFPEKK